MSITFDTTEYQTPQFSYVDTRWRN